MGYRFDTNALTVGVMNAVKPRNVAPTNNHFPYTHHNDPHDLHDFTVTIRATL